MRKSNTTSDKINITKIPFHFENERDLNNPQILSFLDSILGHYDTIEKNIVIVNNCSDSENKIILDTAVKAISAIVENHKKEILLAFACGFKHTYEGENGEENRIFKGLTPEIPEMLMNKEFLEKANLCLTSIRKKET